MSFEVPMAHSQFLAMKQYEVKKKKGISFNSYYFPEGITHSWLSAGFWK